MVMVGSMIIVSQFTSLIIFTSVWLIFYNISVILYVTPLILYPPGWIVTVFLGAFFYYLASLIQIYIFRRPDRAKSTSSVSSKHKEGSQHNHESGAFSNPQQQNNSNSGTVDI
jgi:hypothetical protein